MSTALTQWIADFHFLRPAWLALLAPLAWLCWRLARRADGSAVLERFCDSALLPHLQVRLGAPVRRRLLPFALGGVLGVLALAGPTVERVPQPVYREQTALVVLLDLSRSMNAQDLVPSRLERARFKIRDLLAARRRGQTALLVYTDRAFVVAPLTDDVNTIVSQLSVLEPALMPSQGTDAAAAVDAALALLAQAGEPHGDLLLVTDDVPPAQRQPLARLLAGRDVRLSVLGVGTPVGAPVPDGGGFVQDRAGRTVVARLDADALADVARDGGGRYATLAPDARDVEALTEFFAARANGEVEKAAQRRTEQWEELGPWLLLPLLPLASLAFRRGVLLLVVLGVLAAPRPAAAFDWWFSPDQAGRRAFERKDYEDAARRYTDPAWRAAARYRAGDYAGATQELAGRDDAESAYNRGNALARQGRYEEAIAAYDAALRAAPDDADARYNKSLIEDALRRRDEPPSAAPRESQSADQDRSPQDGQGDGQGQDQNAGGGEADASGSAAEPPATEQDARDAPADEQEESARSPAEAEKTPRETAGNAAHEADDSDPAEAAHSDQSAAARREEALAVEQWLRQVPDDPGGLWRRKFRYQYQRRYGDQPESAEPW